MAKTVLLKESEANLQLLSDSRQMLQVDLREGLGHRPTTGRQRRVVPNWTSLRTSWLSAPGTGTRPGTTSSSRSAGGSRAPNTWFPGTSSLSSSLPMLGQPKSSWGGNGLSSSVGLPTRTPQTPNSYSARAASARGQTEPSQVRNSLDLYCSSQFTAFTFASQIFIQFIPNIYMYSTLYIL